LKFDLIYTFIRILDKQQKNLNLQIQKKSLEKFLIIFVKKFIKDKILRCKVSEFEGIKSSFYKLLLL